MAYHLKKKKKKKAARIIPKAAKISTRPIRLLILRVDIEKPHSHATFYKHKLNDRPIILPKIFREIHTPYINLCRRASIES